jgi:hypothetical protein
MNFRITSLQAGRGMLPRPKRFALAKCDYFTELLHMH